MLTFKKVREEFNKTGGDVWERCQGGYCVVYKQGGKVYDYTAINLLDLAQKLKLDIAKNCIYKHDYNCIVSRIERAKEDIKNTIAGVKDDFDFGFESDEEKIKRLQCEIEELENYIKYKTIL